jgi:hypothetical protein
MRFSPHEVVSLGIFYIPNLGMEGGGGGGLIRGCIQTFPDWVITKYTLTAINTREVT